MLSVTDQAEEIQRACAAVSCEVTIRLRSSRHDTSHHIHQIHHLENMSILGAFILSTDKE